MRFTNKKVSRKAAAITVASALTIFGGAGAALAYWTTTGSGSGSSAVASSNGTLSLAASFGANLAPGQDEVVSFKATTSDVTDLRLGTIHLVSVSVDDDNDSTTPDVAVTDGSFTMADVAANQTIVHGAARDVTATGTLVFHNLAGDQDYLKGKTITLHLSSN